MNGLQQSLLVFLGAGVGANARYWLGAWLTPKVATFPWTTFGINVTGSLLLGLLMGLLERQTETQGWRLLIGVGLLGGYTTFSTFSMEAVLMLKAGHTGQALAYVVGSCVIGIVLAYIGYLVAR